MSKEVEEGSKVSFNLVLNASGDIDLNASLQLAKGTVEHLKGIENRAIEAVLKVFNDNPGARFTPMSLAVKKALFAEVQKGLPDNEYMRLERSMMQYIDRNSDETGAKLFTVQRGKGGGIWVSKDRKL